MMILKLVQVIKKDRLVMKCRRRIKMSIFSFNILSESSRIAIDRKFTISSKTMDTKYITLI